MSHSSRLRFSFGPRIGPGRLITIDGIDGSGKTTLASLVQRYLLGRGVRAVLTRFPTPEMRASRFFELLQRQGRTDLVDPLAFEVQYMVDRIQHCRMFVEPELRAGAFVVTDRYALSSIGTLLLRLPELRSVAVAALTEDAWFRDLCRYLVQPDLSFLLHADPALCVSRLKAREDEGDRDIEVGGYAELQSLLLRLGAENQMVPLRTDSLPEALLAQCVPHLDQMLGDDQRAVMS